MKLLRKQEIFWRQRAKQHWLREGEKNTRFFHKFSSTRKEHNNITKLQIANGDCKETDAEIQEIIMDYFNNLFCSTGAAINLPAQLEFPGLSEPQSKMLVTPIVEEEVKCDVFSMHSDKSPGIDGLNPGFYQAYWDIIGHDVTEFCSKFFVIGELPENVNQTLVCLIPKVKHPKRVDDLGHISLCNMLMKILSKVMANKLKPTLNDIFSENQSAFIEGGLLTDNALITYKIRKTQGKVGVVGGSDGSMRSITSKVGKKPGKYLGMPMCVGRNKIEIFGFLTNRVQQRLKGWYMNKLSRPGKGCRLLKESNPLVSAVMKARYYPASNFLDSDIGTNPSYIWRSILVSKEVIKAGARKRIGDGNDTSVSGVPWLSEISIGYVQTPMPVQLCDITVSSLIHEEGRRWDYEVLHDIYRNRDAGLIKQIPMPLRHTTDTWYWMLDEKWEFTVKSGYRWLQGEFDDEFKQFWSKLWSLKLPLKVNNFFGLSSRLQHSSLHSAFSVIHKVFDECSREKCVQLVMFCWGLWNRRDKWVWDRTNGCTFGVIAAATNLLRDWIEAQILAAIACQEVGAKYEKCVLETDSKMLVQTCNGAIDASFFDTLVDDCVYLSKHINHVLIQFVYKFANRVTYELARATYYMSDIGEWYNIPPNFISLVLDLDI
ncbi:uncharacterized protein LOC141666148 [Apium graveolens]|uniref:uncharacterized protein LOC141666148 n=1 Tax=Apium graveolens TaxID=4045 RepID=UPI003D792B64